LGALETRRTGRPLGALGALCAGRAWISLEPLETENSLGAL
jgi:hypothetical protein